MSVLQHYQDTALFVMLERAIFRKAKEIKRLCGGVASYSAQAILQNDAEIAEKSRFRTRTN